MDEARHVLAEVMLCHVPVVRYNFQQKILYAAVMIRRMLAAVLDRAFIDDRDYYGNKRLDLAGGCTPGVCSCTVVGLWLHCCPTMSRCNRRFVIWWQYGGLYIGRKHGVKHTVSSHLHLLYNIWAAGAALPAGGLMSLLFEDLFKNLNMNLKRQADNVLSKANRAGQFDIAKTIRTDTITYGLESAISSGNWNIKRFKMDRKGVTQVGQGRRHWQWV